ncbi:Hypothetical predicted protein [Cloeon dipterum]|uniref:Uncharacterized protein n=1 Tax=Cloeon dipterum TaxID=197152 RepID=A0A8S1C1S8_9INSE|nr:Hypothetical predicted protein [Cloeon dipterum]
MDTQRTTQRIKRRKRAQRIQAERDKQKSAEAVGKLNDDSADESPTRQKPSKPPSRRKKLKEPLYEEDIIDGFAILAFKTYEDLEEWSTNSGKFANDIAWECNESAVIPVS